MVYYGLGNASLAYGFRLPTPKVDLRSAFPRLRSSASAPTPLQRNANAGAGGDAQGTRTDPLLRGMT